jgi:pyruvate dehydrogenase E2 component (dihydrolipoamide acetyltransferase)
MSTGTAVDVVMPQMGVSVSEGTISRWAKQVGDQVEADETIVEISTDKVDTEVPSPASGVVRELLVGEGETVPVGTRIAVIDTGGGGGDGNGQLAESPTSQEAPAAAEAPGVDTASPAAQASAASLEPSQDRPHFQEYQLADAPSGGQSEQAANGVLEDGGDQRTFMSPVVARMVSEHNLDIGKIPGTGRGGRVTKKDVEKHLAGGQAAAPAAAPASPAAPAAPVPHPAPAPAPPRAAAPAPAVGAADLGPGESAEPLSTIRKVIARNMRHSVDTAAQVTSVIEVDMTRVVNLRKKLNPHYQKTYGVKLSFMPFIMRAVVEAIPHWPWINGEIRGDKVITRDYVNLGIAVAIDDAKGLVVPVIKHAEEKNLLGLSRALIDLADRARAKKLTPDEMSGGTFTITNPGVFGALIGTPIIPQPQVAIIDVEAIVKRPVVVTDEHGGDSIAIRSMMYLPISYDHRLIDGAYSAQFMQLVKKHLESWGEDDY